MNVLVIGYGSIGSRHARLLSSLGCNTAVLSARPVEFPVLFADLATALQRHQPQLVVIANATDHHGDTLLALAQLDFGGMVLVEKPLFHRLLALPALPFRAVFVAYNLRFHPLLQRLREILRGQRLVSLLAYVGQHLPQWRPGTDYRQSYSASGDRGGGVLRDLSHELDYLAWLCGGCTRVCAAGGHLSDLQIDSDDVFALQMATPLCPIVTVQMNYLDRHVRRFILINTTEHTIEADLVRGTLTVDREVETLVAERDGTYRAMHTALLTGEAGVLCSLEEGLATLRLIEAAERSATQLAWMQP